MPSALTSGSQALPLLPRQQLPSGWPQPQMQKFLFFPRNHLLSDLAVPTRGEEGGRAGLLCKENQLSPPLGRGNEVFGEAWLGLSWKVCVLKGRRCKESGSVPAAVASGALPPLRKLGDSGLETFRNPSGGRRGGGPGSPEGRRSLRMAPVGCRLPRTSLGGGSLISGFRASASLAQLQSRAPAAATWLADKVGTHPSLR